MSIKNIFTLSGFLWLRVIMVWSVTTQTNEYSPWELRWQQTQPVTFSVATISVSHSGTSERQVGARLSLIFLVKVWDVFICVNRSVAGGMRGTVWQEEVQTPPTWFHWWWREDLPDDVWAPVKECGQPTCSADKILSPDIFSLDHMWIRSFHQSQQAPFFFLCNWMSASFSLKATKRIYRPKNCCSVLPPHRQDKITAYQLTFF